MKEELDAMEANSTWAMVPLSSNKTLIGCIWVLR